MVNWNFINLFFIIIQSFVMIEHTIGDLLMNRATKTSLILTLILTGAQSFAASNASGNIPVNPTQRAKIEEVVHQYLLTKPEVLVEAMQVLQRRQYEEAEKTVKKTEQNAPQYINALFNQTNDPIAGNPQGNVTVVELSVYILRSILFCFFNSFFCFLVLSALQNLHSFYQNLRFGQEILMNNFFNFRSLSGVNRNITTRIRCGKTLCAS